MFQFKEVGTMSYNADQNGKSTKMCSECYIEFVALIKQNKKHKIMNSKDDFSKGGLCCETAWLGRNDDDLGGLEIDLTASNSHHDAETNGVTNGVTDIEEPSESQPDQQIDLKVQNVVTMFSCCCHIDLRKLALSSCHVMYERNKGVLVKQMKNPKCYVRIWSSGKITVAGCRSESDAKLASRRMARVLQRVLGPKVRFTNYRITNILATCRMPFGIRIDHLAREYPKESTYEPELTTGLVWKSKEPKATLRVHTTGSVTITGAVSEADILRVMENIYPKIVQFKTEK